MTAALDGAGTTSVPAPAVGPDGQTLTIPCETCQGAGVLPENHGGGAVEMLGCPDCWHPDNAAAGEGRVWRYYLLHPSPLGPWILRDAGNLDREPRRVNGCGEGRYWIRQNELHLVERALSNTAAAVVASAVAWRRDRLAAGVDLALALGADDELLGVLEDLDAATDALDRLNQVRRG